MTPSDLDALHIAINNLCDRLYIQEQETKAMRLSMVEIGRFCDNMSDKIQLIERKLNQ